MVRCHPGLTTIGRVEQARQGGSAECRQYVKVSEGADAQRHKHSGGDREPEGGSDTDSNDEPTAPGIPASRGLMGGV